MAMPLPQTIVEDKFESYVATDVQTLAAAVRHELSDYDFKESAEGTSLFHRMFGMKLFALFTAQEFPSRILVFSVHNYFSKIEIRGIARNRETIRKILEGIHAQLGSHLWNFSFKESILVNLPNSAISLLFLIFPSLFFGGITLPSLITSAFLLQFILPTITANLKGETYKKWKPYTKAVMKERKHVEPEENLFGTGFEKERKGEEDWFGEGFERKTFSKEDLIEGEFGKRVKKKEKKKKEKEEEEELVWGHGESDYKWEGVWD